MTIDEQVKGLAQKLYEAQDYSAFATILRRGLIEVARDQRHACAEAVAEVERHGQNCNKEAAFQAVMNAPTS